MAEIKFIDGGVTAAEGFKANGVLSQIKASRKTPDTALIFSEKMCNAAGVFTQNRVQAESVKLSKKNIANGKIQGVIVNSGNANCCTGKQGADVAYRMAKCVAEPLGVSPDDFIVGSTGVIGAQLPVEKIEGKAGELIAGLSKENHELARIAIMTTDTKYKECAVEFVVGGKTVHMGTMCKGSGMIHINMGTMLSFITTDCAISAEMLNKALRESVAGTYNCVSVDGDTSTNDTLVIMANGMAGNTEIVSENEDYNTFLEALNKLNTEMAKKIAADGEGASRMVECVVNGAKSVEIARGLAKEVIRSNLVKAAMFGQDANYGRIFCAMGYSGYEFNPEGTSIFYESVVGGKLTTIQVSDHGTTVDFDEELAKKVLTEKEVTIRCELEDGNATGKAWGCDLTYDYVKINGDYRT